MADQIAGGIELEDGRRRSAALRDRRGGRRVDLARFERAGAMDDPDVVARVHGDADGLPENPLVGERLRPERIDFEARRLHAGRLERRLLLEPCRSQPEPGEHGHKRGTDNNVASHVYSTLTLRMHHTTCVYFGSSCASASASARKGFRIRAARHLRLLHENLEHRRRRRPDVLEAMRSPPLQEEGLAGCGGDRRLRTDGDLQLALNRNPQMVFDIVVHVHAADGAGLDLHAGDPHLAAIDEARRPDARIGLPRRRRLRARRSSDEHRQGQAGDRKR
jgi:hypothetical protein